MSSSALPYNLRTNKAVDRSIFLELLMKMNAYKPIDQYTYIGFGAAHMEDFKQVHSFLGLSKLISIEQDSSIYKRQLLSKPLSCIELRNCTSGNFIQEYDFDENCIIWLDYVSPKQINEQIREFQSVLEKCGKFDIVKISINANPEALGNQNHQETREETFQKRLTKLKARINNFISEEATPEDMTLKGLPKVLLEALLNAASEITRGTGNNFFPLTSFVYTDVNHQMLTLTGILLGDSSSFLDSLQLDNWNYSYSKDKQILRINIPDLTLKERIIIDSNLPCTDYTKIVNELDYGDISSFTNEIENYIKFYRHFPSFSKVLL